VILDGGVVVVGGALNELRGNGDELIVEVDGGLQQSDRLVVQLAASGVAAHSLGPGRVIVTVPDPVVLDLVRDALADAGMGVRRLQPRTASLEEIYLEAAERGHAP
jgi:hypothetical protein